MRRDSRSVGMGAVILAVAVCAGALLVESRQQSVHAAPAAPAVKGTTPAKPASAPVAPDRIVEQFGNWNLICVSPNAQQGAQPACEVNLTVQDPKTKLSVTLAIGTRPGSEREHILVLRVPVSVAVDTPATVSFDGTDALSLPFHTCNSMGCYAEPQAHDDSMIATLRAHDAAEHGRIQWRDSSGRTLSMDASLHGVTDALQAMAVRQP